MITISTEVIINQKVLPYDIYDADKNLLFSAGEILTPGKILAIRDHEKLYIKSQEEIKQANAPKATVVSTLNDDGFHDNKRPPIPQGKINKTSKINPTAQVSLKSEYADAISALNAGEIMAARKIFLNIRDKILRESKAVHSNVHYCSELKLLGEHHECHALNTAIYSAFLGSKLEYSEAVILDIVLGALLHDIGKTKIPTELFREEELSKDQESLYRKHPIYGYNIIKYRLKLPEHIAKIALEHHEAMDGTGWPYGISSTMISELAQVVSVCNYFDDLTSSQPVSEIKSFRDALKALLIKGSRTFSPKPLYAFVHMFNYGDMISFGELLN